MNEKTLEDYLYTQPVWLAISVCLFAYVWVVVPVDNVPTLAVITLFAAVLPLLVAYILIPVGGLAYGLMLSGREDHSLWYGLALVFGPMLVIPFLDSDAASMAGIVYYLLLAGAWMKATAGWFAIVFTFISIGSSIYLVTFLA